MTDFNPQAKDLNELIEKNNPHILEMLSKKGKGIFFPKKGILAQGARAKGKEINATLGTAYEDDSAPMVLKCLDDIINMDKKDVFPYASSYGNPELRKEWKKLLCCDKKNPSLQNKSFSNPVVTCALTHGLTVAGYLFVDPGEEIILPDLFWGNYNLVLGQARDAKLKTFNFFKENNFDIDDFTAKINEGPIGKKVIILNFPNNPSGYTPTKAAADKITAALKELAEKGNNVVVLLDDAYFGLAFEDDIMKESLFTRLVDLHENLLAVKLDGITKEEYAWGFRIGFITFGVKGGNEELYTAMEDKAAGTVRGSISNAPNISQALYLKALSSESYWEEKIENANKIEARYKKVKEILAANPQYSKFFDSLPFNSGYFMCIKLKNLDTQKVWDTLIEKYSTGVIAIPAKSILRMAFASTPIHSLEKLFDNIFNACKDCAK